MYKPDIIHVCGQCTFYKELFSPEKERMLLAKGLTAKMIEELKNDIPHGLADVNDVLGLSILFMRIGEMANISRNILFDVRYILDGLLPFAGRTSR
jgi:hypothetical protein